MRCRRDMSLYIARFSANSGSSPTLTHEAQVMQTLPQAFWWSEPSNGMILRNIESSKARSWSVFTSFFTRFYHSSSTLSNPIPMAQLATSNYQLATSCFPFNIKSPVPWSFASWQESRCKEGETLHFCCFFAPSTTQARLSTYPTFLSHLDIDDNAESRSGLFLDFPLHSLRSTIIFHTASLEAST